MTAATSCISEGCTSAPVRQRRRDKLFQLCRRADDRGDKPRPNIPSFVLVDGDVPAYNISRRVYLVARLN